MSLIGIGPLVCGTRSRAFSGEPARVRQRCETFQRRAQDVQSHTDGDHARHGPGVVGVDDAQTRSERPVTDGRLHLHAGDPEDGHPRDFAAGTRSRGHGDHRPERTGNGQALPDGRVHVVEEVGRIGRVQVGGLRGIYRRPAPDGEIPVECSGGCELRGGLEREIARLYAHLVVDNAVDALATQGIECDRHGLAVFQVGVHHRHHAPGAEGLEVVAYLTRCPGTELDAR